MKTLILSALLAGFGATVAAQEIIPFDDHFVSTRTRAEVLAEVSQAAMSGDLYRQQGEITWMPSLDTFGGPSRSRAEVRQEVSLAAASGELYRQQGEITWIPDAVNVTSHYASSGSPSVGEEAGSPVLLATDSADKAGGARHCLACRTW
jgi:hypothetical protein